MSRIVRMTCAAVAGAMFLAACAEKEETSYTQTETVALRAWMEINRPELLENYQADGGYYVDVLDLGDPEQKPFGNEGLWVRYTFTGRNLSGDVVLTRNEVDARQVGSFTKFTHYVPYYKYYAGDVNTSLPEGTYLAMRNKLTLGAAYAAQKGFPREVHMSYGTKVTLYMPSTIVSTGGVSGSGGYEGQKGYELRSGYPFVVTMQITDVVENPLEREGTDVDQFAELNGRLKRTETPSKTTDVLPFDPGDYDDGYAWRNVVDSIPQLYVSLIYTPTTRYMYPKTYQSVYAPYSAFGQLEQNICDTLVNRFGVYEGPLALDAEIVGKNGSAKIWYIGRFLDGFIFDSNIPGVRDLVYGDKSGKATPIDYKPSTSDLPAAFGLTIPRLRYGQWAAILTTSTNAYGAIGVSGTTNTSSSSNNNPDYIDYNNSMNGYYGNDGYYGGYYGGYYNEYMNGQYNNSTPGNANTTTKTTISTEILPFTPLLFQIYIEPKQE